MWRTTVGQRVDHAGNSECIKLGVEVFAEISFQLRSEGVTFD